MKRAGCLLVLIAGVAQATMIQVPADETAWDGDPITWKFRADGIHGTVSNGTGIAVYEAAPLASVVTVEARFTPQQTTCRAWNIAEFFHRQKYKNTPLSVEVPIW